MNTITTPVLWYTRVLGIVLTVLGIAALATTTEQSAVTSVVGFDVNLTHGIILLATGVLGMLAGFVGTFSTRAFTMIAAIVYTILGVWGMLADGDVAILEHVNQSASVMHLLVGVTGIAFWFAMQSELDRTEA